MKSPAHNHKYFLIYLNTLVGIYLVKHQSFCVLNVVELYFTYFSDNNANFIMLILDSRTFYYNTFSFRIMEAGASTGKAPSSKPWASTGDRLKDDLNFFTTGNFYDCTFKVSNDVTNESKVSSNSFPIYPP
jgi:hypothetical protein